jgi:hypothetical protein
MRSVCLLQAVVLLSISLATEAFAGPITGESMVSAGEEATTTERREPDPRSDASAFSAAALFDGAGLPLLRLSAPIYMQLTAPVASSQDGPGGGGIQEFFAAPEGFLPGLNLTAGLVFGVDPTSVQPAAIPEPAILWLLAPSLLLLRRRRIRPEKSRE